MKTVMEYLKECEEMAWHNRLCYSANYGMTVPKEGFEAQFEEAGRDIEIAHELIVREKLAAIRSAVSAEANSGGGTNGDVVAGNHQSLAAFMALLDKCEIEFCDCCPYPTGGEHCLKSECENGFLEWLDSPSKVPAAGQKKAPTAKPTLPTEKPGFIRDETYDPYEPWSKGSLENFYRRKAREYTEWKKAAKFLEEMEKEGVHDESVMPGSTGE